MRIGESNTLAVLFMSLVGEAKRSYVRINERQEESSPSEVQSSRSKEEVEWDTLERLVMANKFTGTRNRTNLGGPCV